MLPFYEHKCLKLENLELTREITGTKKKFCKVWQEQSENRGMHPNMLVRLIARETSAQFRAGKLPFIGLFVWSRFCLMWKFEIVYTHRMFEIVPVITISAELPGLPSHEIWGASHLPFKPCSNEKLTAMHPRRGKKKERRHVNISFGKGKKKKAAMRSRRLRTHPQNVALSVTEGISAAEEEGVGRPCDGSSFVRAEPGKGGETARGRRVGDGTV